MNFRSRIQRVTGLSAVPATNRPCCNSCAMMNRTFGMGGFFDDLWSGVTGGTPSDASTPPSTGSQIGSELRDAAGNLIQAGRQYLNDQISGGTGQPNTPGGVANAPATGGTTQQQPESNGTKTAAIGGSVALLAALGIGAYLLMK